MVHLGKILLCFDSMLSLLMVLPEFMGPITLIYCTGEGNSIAIMILIVSLGPFSGVQQLLQRQTGNIGRM